MKCLPQAKIGSCNGNVLHDCHAEVLAVRAFNRYLLEQCAELGSVSYERSRTTIESSIAEWSEKEIHGLQPFKIKDDCKIHMYCSEAPCGDASMELTMAAQEDSTPWTGLASAEGPLRTEEHSHPPGHTTAVSVSDGLHGRGYFDQLGIVRRKPARPDAPITVSKSCSDKLALKQCTSVLSSITSMFIEPGSAYLTSLVLPGSQYVADACQRSFSAQGRMKAANEASSDDPNQSAFRPFAILSTSREFCFSRRIEAESGIDTVTPTNLAIVSTHAIQEILINGVLQGRKQTDPKGASMLSRRKMWELARWTAQGLDVPELKASLDEPTYAQLKESPLLDERRHAKVVAREGCLSGWKVNSGDDDWGI